jgi:hypothetical protein
MSPEGLIPVINIIHKTSCLAIFTGFSFKRPLITLVRFVYALPIIQWIDAIKKCQNSRGMTKFDAPADGKNIGY